MRTSTIVLLGAAAAASAWTADGIQELQERQSNWTVGQTVQTSSGPVNGHAASNDSEVSEYLGIPFALPPVGDLRFAPPRNYSGTSTINGTNFGFSCPVKQSTTAPANNSLTQSITTQGEEILEVLDQVGDTFSEDCLTLNVWTKPQTGEAKKAVLVWIYGGGFTSGSSDSVAYNGDNIANQEDVVVVSINYRVNIFGFPGYPVGSGSSNNLGLLDQRLAIEWVRTNIAAFAGDPARITIFGQSAGGASVDYYTFAWTSDPIVAGFIEESGTAFSFDLPYSANASATAWYNITATLGCGNETSNSAAVLSCMRALNYTAILNAMPAASAASIGTFGPTVDNTIVFSDYLSRAISGNFIKKPLLIGNNDNEAGLFEAAFALEGSLFSQAFWESFNLEEFTCPAGIRSNVSVLNNVPTWRYLYFGDFPDLTIFPGSGAWHGAELPLLFDVTPTSPPATAAEVSIANYMRGAWAAFAKDPVNGLNSYQGGWPQYQSGAETLVRLAYNNLTGTNLALPSLYDANCSLYNETTGSNATATVSPSKSSSTAATSSSPSATPSTTKSGASRISMSLLVVYGAIIFAWMI